MISPETTEQILGLPEKDRLELARRLIESIAAERNIEGAIENGVRRIEDVVSGRTVGLTEAQFRDARR